MTNPVKHPIHELDTVALLEDIPASGLVCGQVGTVVMAYSPTDFEVEFSDSDGHAYATLKDENLMRLYHEPTDNGRDMTKLALLS